MPDIERRGVTYSEALQEAAAIAPIGRAMLYAYELWHPTLSAPLRFVDDKADLTATLEADAPRNAGATVEFVACPLAVARPEESDTAAAPTITMGRPDVAGLLREAADTARGSLEPWELIERVFASDDTSEPALLPPRRVEMLGLQINAASGALEFGFDDDNSEAVPAIRFTRRDYPGLQR